MELRRIATFCASLEIWFVSLAVGASMVSTLLLLPSVAIICLFWIIRWIAFGTLSKRTPADWAILGLILTIPVTLWATVSTDSTITQVLRLLSGIGLYYAIVNWTRTKRELTLLGLGSALLGIFLSAVGLLAVEWTTGKLPFISSSVYQMLPKLNVDPIHRNVMAGVLVIIMPFSLASVVFSWRSLNKLQQILYGLSTLIMLVMVVLTQSRGGVIALTCATLLMISLRWKRGWLLLVIILAGFFIGDRLFGILQLIKTLMTADMLGGFEGRLEIWSRGIMIIKDFPFTGVGMGNFGIVVDTLYPFLLNSAGSVPHAHNLYLQIAADLGLPGLIAWLAILLTMLTTSWHLFQKGTRYRDFYCIGLGAGLMCCQIALAIHGLLDSVTWGMVRPAPMVWVIWGVTVATAEIFQASSTPISS